MAATLEQLTVLPPDTPEDTELSRRLASLIEAIDASPRAGGAALVGPDGTKVALSDEVYAVLRDVAQAMAHGRGVTIVPRDAVLTTQQAADLLNISRPTLVKLLREGQIPFDKPGRHRKVRLADVLEYQHRARQQRRAALDELTRTASEDGTADSVEGFVQTR